MTITSRHRLKDLFNDTSKLPTSKFHELIDALWDPKFLYSEKTLSESNLTKEDTESVDFDERYVFARNIINKESSYIAGIGFGNTYNSDFAQIYGYGNTANSFYETIIGHYGLIATGQTPDSWVATDRLFTLANGTDKNNRHDAVNVYKSGYTTLFNAIAIGEYDHGDDDPLIGTLQVLLDSDRLQLYTSAAWKSLAFTLDLNNYALLNHTHANLHSPITISTPGNGLTLNDQLLGMQLSSSSTTGALSSTDWNTFNNKVGGSGTTGRVPYFANSYSISDTDVYWDAVNGRIGLNIAIPTAKLHIYEPTITATSLMLLRNEQDGASLEFKTLTEKNAFLIKSGSSDYLHFSTNNSNTPVLSITPTYKVGIRCQSPLADLDIQSGNIGLVLGADNGLFTRTANTIKGGRMGVPHYDITALPTAVFFAYNTESINQLTIGGGSSVLNAVTFIAFYTANNTTTPTGTEVARFTSNKFGLGVTTPTARLHIAAGTASAGTASVKINSGTLLTNPEAGAIESNGTNLYWTDSTSVRRQLDNRWISDSTGINYTEGKIGIGCESFSGSKLKIQAISGEYPLLSYGIDTPGGRFLSDSSDAILCSSSTGGGLRAGSVSGVGLWGSSTSNFSGVFSGGLGVNIENGLTLSGFFKIKETGDYPQFYSTFQAGNQTSDLTYTLPTAYPAGNGYALVSSASGVMSWSSIAPMSYPGAGIPVSTGSVWGTSITSTAVGVNLLTLSNPGAIRFIRINADNSISALSDSDFRTALNVASWKTNSYGVYYDAGNVGIGGGISSDYKLRVVTSSVDMICASFESSNSSTTNPIVNINTNNSNFKNAILKLGASGATCKYIQADSVFSLNSAGDIVMSGYANINSLKIGSTEVIDSSRVVNATGYKINGVSGVSGTITSANTVTVTGGIITAIT